MAVKDVILISILLVSIGVTLFLLGYVNHKIIDGITNTTIMDENPNVQASIRVYNTQVNPKLDYLFLAVFIGLVFGLMVSAWFIDSHPIFMVLFIIVLIIGVAMSTILANFWETIANNIIFENNISNYPITNHILLNLPYYLAVIGVIGMIVVFGKPKNLSFFGGGNGGEGYQ
jgi:hypothetical protein